MNVKDADWFCVEAKILPGVFQYRKKSPVCNIMALREITSGDKQSQLLYTRTT